jgi:hypothetical protein
MQAIQIEAFGHPVEVLTAVDRPDVGASAAGAVVIALEALPIKQYALLASTDDRKEMRCHGARHSTACMTQALWVEKGAQPWYRRRHIRTQGPSPCLLP